MTRAALAKALPYALVGAGAGYLYHTAAHIEYQERAGALGPDFWPKAILVLLIVVCVFEIVRLIAFGAREEAAGPETGALESLSDESPEAHGDTVVEKKHPVLLLSGIGATLLYVAAVQRLGFFLATVAYLAAFMLIGGYRRPLVIAAVSVIGTLGLLFVFMKLVYVSLPIGVEPFSQVTLWLMAVMGIR